LRGHISRTEKGTAKQGTKQGKNTNWGRGGGEKEGRVVSQGGVQLLLRTLLLFREKLKE